MKKTKENNLSKRGISLIVLVITIIVIIILAAAVILTLTGNNPIENAKQATYINDLSAFQDELDMYKTNEYAKNQGDFDQNTLDATGETMYTYIPSMTGKTKYTVELEILDGKLVYAGDENSIHKDWAAMANILEKPVTIGINDPVLATGMTPIKWDASGNLLVTTADDTSWYDYTNKKWANARTADGSMWVWIPRYEYDIPTLNEHTSTPGTININFLYGTNKTPSNSEYTIHPAFTFGTTELKGIWVAKFEASGTISTIASKPDLIAVRSLTIDAIFTACRNMETTNGIQYGWGTTGTGIDTHLTKNTEWGAVAYLTQSIYGKNSEVWVNPNTSYKTGQSGLTVSAAATGSTLTYNNLTYGINASTTGNCYGLYDMSGGAWEYVSAYVDNNNTNLTTYGASVVSAPSQYKDVYTVTTDDYTNNYNNTINKKGDAIWETSTGWGSTQWYSDFSYMPYDISPYPVRGGQYNSAINSGIFAMTAQYGSSYANTGFRPTLLVSPTLL